MKNRIENEIHVYDTKNVGSAELSRIIDTEYLRYLEKAFDIAISTPIFFFNRIKVQEEGQGHGRKLMEELTEILDQHEIAVFCVLNPYGKRRMKDLIRFYEKNDFIILTKSKGYECMIRYPKVKEKATVKAPDSTSAPEIYVG